MAHWLYLSMHACGIPQSKLEFAWETTTTKGCTKATGTKAHLSCRKGYKRVYEKGYECNPFVQNLRIPLSYMPFVHPFVPLS